MEILYEIGFGLLELKSNETLHGNINPNTIVITDSCYKITDFGNAHNIYN